MSECLLSNSVPAVRDGGQGLRSEPRSKVFKLVALVIGGRVERAHVLDVSVTGARLHCRAAASPDEVVELRADPVRAKGQIMWASDGRLGIRFHRRLSRNELAAFME